MKSTRPHAVAVAAGVATACLLAACGTSSPATRPTRTVTVTVPAGTSQPATPAPSASAAGPQAGPPGCATSALKLALGSGSAAAGSSYYPIEFTNSSGSACTLYGYPGVSFVSASGSQIGAAATEDPVYPRELITLAPGATAHADLRIADALNYPAATCTPVSASQVKVFPPGQTSALYLGVTATACASSSVQILGIQTVQPGS